MTLREFFEKDYRFLFIAGLSSIIFVVFYTALCIYARYHSSIVITDQRLHTLFLVVGVGFSLVSNIMGIVIYNRRLKELKTGYRLSEDKIVAYRLISLAHIACSSIPTLVVGMCYMISGDWIFLLLNALSVFELVRLFPGTKRIDTVVSYKFNATPGKASW